MKTTDSVKDKFIKWLAEESGEPEHLVMLMQSVYVNPESMLKFYSHSLAEARREVDERCERAEKLLDDMVTMFGKQNSDLHIIQEVRDLMALRIKEGKSVTATWRRELNLLTGDNPERKV